MRLILRKNQSRSLLGAPTFEVHAQAELTPEERELVSKYRQEGVVVLQKPIFIFGIKSDKVVNITAGQLISGETFKCKDLGEVISYCEAARSACENLKAYLDVARGFGGEEILEISSAAMAREPERV